MSSAEVSSAVSSLLISIAAVEAAVGVEISMGSVGVSTVVGAAADVAEAEGEAVASGTAVLAVNEYEAEAFGEEVEVVVTAPD